MRFSVVAFAAVAAAALAPLAHAAPEPSTRMILVEDSEEPFIYVAPDARAKDGETASSWSFYAYRTPKGSKQVRGAWLKTEFDCKAKTSRPVQTVSVDVDFKVVRTDDKAGDPVAIEAKTTAETEFRWACKGVPMKGKPFASLDAAIADMLATPPAKP